jgi:Tfp pilus assembly protein PilF
MDEDEPTTRMDLESLQVERMMQVPPAEQTPLVTVTGPRPQPPAPGSRLAKRGVGLFLLGVLVGIAGAAIALTQRATPPAPTASPTPPVIAQAAAPATAARALTAVTDPLPHPAIETPRAAPPIIEPKKLAPEPAPEPELPALPVSRSQAPSCQQLLGEPPVKRQSTKAATRETQLANRQLVLGNVAMAHAAYCNAFALDQANVDRHVNLARLYLVRRDWEKAAALGQSGLKLDPKHRGALGVLGDAWAALNKSGEARKMMLAAEGKPDATARELKLMVRRNLALAQRVARLNDFLLAERLYRRVLLVDPRQAEAASGVARCLLKAGDFRAAEAWARHARQLKSGH